MRIEPPPSLAWAIGNIPAATAAAAPPLEPPGRACRIPWVASDPVAAVLSDRDHAELRRVRAPAQHEPGALQRLDDELALLAHPVRGAVRAVGDRPSRDWRQVLDRQRHAEEWGAGPARRPRGGGRPPPRAARASSSLRQMTAFSCGPQRIDRRHARIQQLGSGQLAPAQRRGELHAGEKGPSEAIAATLPGRLAAWPAPLLGATELDDRDRQHHRGRAARRPPPRRGPARASSTR